MTGPEGTTGQAPFLQRRGRLKDAYVRLFRTYQYQTEQKLARYADGPTMFPPELLRPFQNVRSFTDSMVIEQDNIRIRLGISHGIRPADSIAGFVERYNITYPEYPIDEASQFTNVNRLTINNGKDITPQYYAPIFIRENVNAHRGSSGRQEIIVLGDLRLPATLLILLHEIGHAKTITIGSSGDIADTLKNPDSKVYYDEALTVLESEEKAWQYAREQLEPFFRQGNQVFNRDSFEQIVNLGMRYYANLVQRKIDSGKMDYRNRIY